MPKLVRLLVFIVLPIVGGGAFLWYLGAFPLAGRPVNTVREEIVSPNGAKKIVVFVRDGGATARPTAQASLLEKSGRPADGPGNVFAMDSAPARVMWQDDTRVVVVIRRGARATKKESMVSGVAIEYRAE